MNTTTQTAEPVYTPVNKETTYSPAYHAFLILRWGFAALPIIAGVDKFSMILANWSQYLWPPLGNLVGGPNIFMKIVGVVEIIAGLLVAFKPKIGAPVVALWLWGIIANLLLIHNYYDVALRDFGLSLGAIALARLSCQYQKVK